MSTKRITQLRTADMAMIAMFAAVISICAWICIPGAVPFTLQTFGIFLSVGVLGGQRGTLAVAVYLLLGMTGIPVFSGFTGGIGCLFNSTGGYIMGFLVAALMMWLLEHVLGKKRWVLLLSMVLGLLVCYLFGTMWFVVIYTNQTGEISIWTALTLCVFPYVIPDAVKIAAAFLISKKLGRICREGRLPTNT